MPVPPFKLNLHSHAEFISDYIRIYNCWEPFTTELINELLTVHADSFRHNHVFLDVGANIGYFSVLIGAYNLMPVIAVEPVFENLQVLYKSVEDNTFRQPFVVLPCAIGDERKLIEMKIDTMNFGCCSTRENLVFAKTQFVQQRRLDECLRELAFNEVIPDLHNKRYIVKLDIEEQELPVLKSLSPQFLQQVDVFIVEISKDVMEAFDLLVPYFDCGIMLENSEMGVYMRYCTLSLSDNLQMLMDIQELRNKINVLLQRSVAQVDLLLMKRACLRKNDVLLNNLFE